MTIEDSKDYKSRWDVLWEINYFRWCMQSI